LAQVTRGRWWRCLPAMLDAHATKWIGVPLALHFLVVIVGMVQFKEKWFRAPGESALGFRNLLFAATPGKDGSEASIIAPAGAPAAPPIPTVVQTSTRPPMDAPTTPQASIIAPAGAPAAPPTSTIVQASTTLPMGAPTTPQASTAAPAAASAPTAPPAPASTAQASTAPPMAVPTTPQASAPAATGAPTAPLPTATVQASVAPTAAPTTSQAIVAQPTAPANTQASATAATSAPAAPLPTAAVQASTAPPMAAPTTPQASATAAASGPTTPLPAYQWGLETTTGPPRAAPTTQPQASATAAAASAPMAPLPTGTAQASAATSPAAPTTPQAEMSFDLNNLNYTELESNPQLKSEVETAVKEKVAAVTGVSAEDVKVNLSQALAPPADTPTTTQAVFLQSLLLQPTHPLPTITGTQIDQPTHPLPPSTGTQIDIVINTTHATHTAVKNTLHANAGAIGDHVVGVVSGVPNITNATTGNISASNHTVNACPVRLCPACNSTIQPIIRQNHSANHSANHSNIIFSCPCPACNLTYAPETVEQMKALAYSAATSAERALQNVSAAGRGVPSFEARDAVATATAAMSATDEAVRMAHQAVRIATASREQTEHLRGILHASARVYADELAKVRVPPPVVPFMDSPAYLPSQMCPTCPELHVAAPAPAPAFAR